MKKFGKALLVIGLAILGLWYMYDTSEADLKKARSRFNSLDQQVKGLISERDRYTGEIVTLNRNVKESSAFLSAWVDHYNVTKDVYENLLTEVAEKSGCVVVERNWGKEEKSAGKLSYQVDTFKGKVVGDYRNIVKFIGEMETTLQLSSIWDLEFKVGSGSVTCSILVHLPTLDFEGVKL